MTATDTGYLTEENFSGLLSWEPSSRRDKLLDYGDYHIHQPQISPDLLVFVSGTILLLASVMLQF
uniref:Uncharacterized protein n=1 Tax=Arion vulgaris TaxID=1028688 RepID=A0A0B7AVG3_9EUPU